MTKNMRPIVTTDREGMAMYVRLKPAETSIADTEEIKDALVIVDYDSNGEAIGIELLRTL